MTVIIVSGPGNTGKTTGIRLAMEMVGIKIMQPGDITLQSSTYLKNGQVNISGIGFASDGDSASIVTKNIAFFAGNQISCLVFACRSKGKTSQILQNYCQSINAIPAMVYAKYPANSRSLAQQIFNYIP